MPATIFYAAATAAAGLAEAAVWLYAIRIRDLALPGNSPSVRRWVLRIIPTPMVFLVSIPVAITRPDLAKYLWPLVLVSGLVLPRLEPTDEEPATTDELGG